MFTPKHIIIASVITVFTAFHPHISSAESFKGSEFLTWKYDTQHFYIENTVGVATTIAGRNLKKHADCIEDWYYSDQKNKDNIVLEVIQSNPEYHPRGVILSILEKKCGTFKY